MSTRAAIDELLTIMARLRDPKEGCPWDVEQTFRTIAPYTIEEAYEVADAIERDDHRQLCDELGDLLLQVVFHAQMAREAGLFEFEDAVRAISGKLRRRHPHVFGDDKIASAAEQTRAWESHKARERSAEQRDAGVLDDVPLGFPALTRAAKLGKRAAGVGFDWPDWRGARDKIDEELTELDQARAAGQAPERIAAEVGDLLFAVVNLARHLGVDPEAALRSSNGRFSRRFRHLEARVRASGRSVADLDLAALDELWNEAKKATPDQ
ncbi:MAG TPA: nucleoside triphosphate pyrophosphohydrolase [Steroidobacteraceae bacterium]|nr:nucleoside triphosphate pyrophosphohydrolase [Steroidobacteraceae bacterium]